MSSVQDQQRSVVIQNKFGLHARPAAEFVKQAHKFSCDVWVRKDELEVNGKSIMGMMMLAAEKGSEIVIRASGGDAEEAVEALAEMVLTRFGED